MAVQFLLSSKLLWLQQLVLSRDFHCEPQPLHLYGQLELVAFAQIQHTQQSVNNTWLHDRPF